jgi:hypothetical protein
MRWPQSGSFNAAVVAVGLRVCACARSLEACRPFRGLLSNGTNLVLSAAVQARPRTPYAPVAQAAGERRGRRPRRRRRAPSTCCRPQTRRDPPPTPASTSTSLPPRHPGSTLSRSGSASSNAKPSTAAPSATSENSPPRSRHSSPAGTTAHPFVWTKTANQILTKADRQPTSNTWSTSGAFLGRSQYGPSRATVRAQIVPGRRADAGVRRGAACVRRPPPPSALTRPVDRRPSSAR